LSGFTTDPTAYTFDLDKVSIGVPEPASAVLLVLGAIGVWMLWQRRQGRTGMGRNGQLEQ
jgi:hypothetical protein